MKDRKRERMLRQGGGKRGMRGGPEISKARLIYSVLQVEYCKERMTR